MRTWTEPWAPSELDEVRDEKLGHGHLGALYRIMGSATHCPGELDLDAVLGLPDPPSPALPHPKYLTALGKEEANRLSSLQRLQRSL